MKKKLAPIHVASYNNRKADLAAALVAPEDLRVVYRLGGTANYEKYDIHVNSAQAVRNCVDKLKQKQLLIAAGLATLPLLGAEPQNYPCVIKGRVRSGGNAVKIVQNGVELNVYKRDFDNFNQGYLIEPLFIGTSEYRLHCTRKEVFFTVKKVKQNKEDIIITARNHNNTREFVKPRLWKEIHATCLKAMEVLDLDVAAFDIMYNSANNEKHEYFIAEANTSPELLENTFNAYVEVVNKLIAEKVEEFRKPKPEPVQVNNVEAAPAVEMVPMDGGITADEKCKLIAAVMAGHVDIMNGALVVTVARD